MQLLQNVEGFHLETSRKPFKPAINSLNGVSTLTLGREALEPELCVVIVRTVVMPRPTLAGAASMFIQNDTQDRMTIRREGMYIWIR